jgi:hypothetical protein
MAGFASPKTQKNVLQQLLSKLFGEVEIEKSFDWLRVPSMDKMDETMSRIHGRLCVIRGYHDFIKPGRPLRCDFYIPNIGLVIEYDERQHFTMQRAATLRDYPTDLRLGFDKDEWIRACEKIKATDPDPVYRDEQRAFYDCLRDMLAARNGLLLVRLQHRTEDWTNPGSYDTLSRKLKPHIHKGDHLAEIPQKVRVE